MVEQQRGPRGPHPNRVSPDVEQAILDFYLVHPTKGSQFVANQLRLQGVEAASPACAASGSVMIYCDATSACFDWKPPPATPPSSCPTSRCACRRRPAATRCHSTSYITPAEIQRDLDTFLRYYNLERSHRGYRLKGRTPAQALREALTRKTLPPIVPEPEETTENEAEKLIA